MRTYVAPIGYDTRRVTRPVVRTGLSSKDRVVLVRPHEDTDTPRATQAIQDATELLEDGAPGVECVVERVGVDTFEETVLDCCLHLSEVPAESDLLVSLGSGARDVLLPLTVASLVFARRIERALFFSDIDDTVREWSLPALAPRIPEHTRRTFEHIAGDDGWLPVAAIAAETDQSTGTVSSHVTDLEERGLVISEPGEGTGRVRPSFAGRLVGMAHEQTP